MLMALVKSLARGLAPHLPDGVSVVALPPGILAVRRGGTSQPPERVRLASVLRYDLVEAGATDHDDEVTTGVILWVLSALQAELSEWSGRPWPTFPTARVESSGGPARWQVHTPEGSSDVIGYVSPSGWSLRVMTVSASPSS